MSDDYLIPEKRYELAVTLREISRNQWERLFFRSMNPSDPLAADVSGGLGPSALHSNNAEVSGDDLFKVLFGTNKELYNQLFSLIFNKKGKNILPSWGALRLHILYNESVQWICQLPWTQLSYNGQMLIAKCDWTVELHVTSRPPMFPPLTPHFCHFPDRVVVLEGKGVDANRHIEDFEQFARLPSWRGRLTLRKTETVEDLRAALGVGGSPRLFYYFGSANADGLTLQLNQKDSTLAWAELLELLESTQSLSLTYFNFINTPPSLIGPLASSKVVHETEQAAILVSCCHSSMQLAAQRAATDWLNQVFGFSADPVMMLHKCHARYESGAHLITWSQYDYWQVSKHDNAVLDSEHFSLSLDRTKQKDTLYGQIGRVRSRVLVNVVYGEAGNRVYDFPEAFSLHLNNYKHTPRLVEYKPIKIDEIIDATEQLEAIAQRDLRWDNSLPLINFLRTQNYIPEEQCIVVLGWRLNRSVKGKEGIAILEMVAEWCESRIAKTLVENTRNNNILVVSLIAIELEENQECVQFQEALQNVHRKYERKKNDDFDFSVSDVLIGVNYSDLKVIFRNRELVAQCDDDTRELFPDLLLGPRSDLPFELVVKTLQRGYGKSSNNWGSLFDELDKLTKSGDWPPHQYDSHYWEKIYGKR